MTDATTEPTEAIAGDTWAWTKTLADYPAPTWILTYYFRGRSGEFSISASADGSDHSISVAKATSAAYKAGEYFWHAVVTDGSSRYTVASGALLVKPDPSQLGEGFDGRSHVRRVLDAIEAVIEGRATKDQQSYTINNRSLQRTPIEDLLLLRDRYRAELANELAAAGLGESRRIGVRFERP